jgi:hypothetical protein
LLVGAWIWLVDLLRLLKALKVALHYRIMAFELATPQNMGKRARALLEGRIT